MSEIYKPRILNWFEPLRRYVPLAVWIITILTLLLIPLKIIGYGFLPSDDALRHAGKAVSGKSWSEVLVLNETYKIDHEYGWNLLLEQIHTAFNANTETILLFSVMSLFLLVALAALPWLRYPESWLATLSLAMVASILPVRLLMGRPFLITTAALMSLLLLWKRFGCARPKWWMTALMTGLITVSVYFHGAWYLWVLPIAAFFLARQFRWGLTAAGCWGAGVFLGSLLTGHLIDYPMQAVKVALLAAGHPNVVELEPCQGDLNILFLVGSLLLLRRFAGLNALPFLRDPVFWLLCLGWTLGFKVGRFWYEWGWPALLVIVVCDLQLLFASRVAVGSFQRLWLTGGMALIAFLTITSDGGSRWTACLTKQYLTTDNPDLNGWLPEKGGIFYSTDMGVFYETFYKNPKADWRYILGFEATLMPRKDFEVFHKILWNFGDAKAYAPWVLKMNQADRLAIRGTGGNPPNIAQLEWNYGVSGTWIGRLPGERHGGAPAIVPATKTRDLLTNSASSMK